MPKRKKLYQKDENKTLKVLVEYFLKRQWQVTQSINNSILYIEYKDNLNRSVYQWKCRAIVNETIFKRKIVFFSFIPFRISSDNIELVTELLHKINCLEDFGNFEINYEREKARCKTGVEIRRDSITSSLIQDVVENNIELI